LIEIKKPPAPARDDYHAVLRARPAAGQAGLEQEPGCVDIADFDIADGTIRRSRVRAVNVMPADPAKPSPSARP